MASKLPWDDLTPPIYLAVNTKKRKPYIIVYAWFCVAVLIAGAIFSRFHIVCALLAVLLVLAILLKKYDAVLYKRDDTYVMHRILKVRDRDYWIVGDHCRVGEFVKDEQILGVLKQVVRDGRTIRTTDPCYQVYVHLWCDFFPVRSTLLFLKAAALKAGRQVKRLGKR